MLDISPFVKTFNELCYGSDESKVFEDFLDICICCLSGERYEDEYLSIIKRYSKEKVDLFVTLFSQMVIIMDNDGTGLTDCLGEFFQNHITKGKNGQFFTPPHVTDMMAQMILGEETKEKTIMDPACGSGRMLLSAAKVSRRNYFFGADLDNRCSKMCVINLCLNGLIGEVAWMNSLTLEHWGGYEIFYDTNRLNVPTIKKLNANEGVLANQKFDKVSEESSNVVSINTPITVTQFKMDL
jgi:type I restriction-modification system DNA methylase subunit